MTKDRMIAGDIIQSAFEKFYLNMQGIIKAESARYWLFTTVRNLVYEHFRRQKIRLAEDITEVELSDEYSNPDVIFEAKELKQSVNESIDKLGADLKEVFVLKEYGGLSYEEIAAALSIEEKLVKSRLFNARRKLLKILSGKIKNRQEY